MRDRPDDRTLQNAVSRLRRGGVIAIPTETFYGLAADAANPEAMERVNLLKGKPRDAPVLLLAADLLQVAKVADVDVPRCRELTKAFWPGPLTLVLPARPGVPRPARDARGTVAVRVADASWPQALAEGLGGPITGPSANPHGAPPPRTAAEVRDAFGEALDAIVDGGRTPGGAPSTLLDLSGPRPRILRRGAVSDESLLRVFPADAETDDFPA